MSATAGPAANQRRTMTARPDATPSPSDNHQGVASSQRS